MGWVELVVSYKICARSDGAGRHIRAMMMVGRSGSLLLVRLVVLLVAAHNSCCAQQCSEATAEELDGLDGLLSTAYASAIGGDNPTPPDVELLDFNVVCLATSERSGFYRYYKFGRTDEYIARIVCVGPMAL